MASIAPPSHTRGKHTTDDWITPKWMIDALGPFDLDPCESDTQPWPCAQHRMTKREDGLAYPWSNLYGGKPLVWLNPPYGKATGDWLAKLADHNNGIALVFARTETKMFFDHVWPKATSLLFLKGRLTFCYPDGTGSKARHNSGGPSVLIGYGEEALRRLEATEGLGAFVKLR